MHDVNSNSVEHAAIWHYTQRLHVASTSSANGNSKGVPHHGTTVRHATPAAILLSCSIDGSYVGSAVRVSATNAKARAWVDPRDRDSTVSGAGWSVTL